MKYNVLRFAKSRFAKSPNGGFWLKATRSIYDKEFNWIEGRQIFDLDEAGEWAKSLKSFGEYKIVLCAQE